MKAQLVLQKSRSYRRSMLFASAWGLLFAPASLICALLVDGCGNASDSATGKRVTLRTQLTVEKGGSEFDNAYGWSVKLEEAFIAGGELYYFRVAPPIARRPKSHVWRLAWQPLLGVNVAHAHPGHYQAGDALGEMVEPWSADLLRGTARLPDGHGVTGRYRSARFSFSAKVTGSVVRQLDGHAAVVRGTAMLEGEEPRYFVASAGLDDIGKSVSDGAIYGCRFEEVDVEADGAITVQVRPRVWFELVDFGELSPGSEAEPTAFPADSQPLIAFAQGLADLSAYQFSYDEE